MAGELIQPAVVDEAAPAEGPAPVFAATEKGKAVIANPDGSLGLIDPADGPAALAQGLRPATKDEIHRELLGTGGRVAAAAIGAGQGLTMGYGVPAILGAAKAVGADDFAERARNAIEITKHALPNEYMGGEIAGSLAGMALLPGAGAAKGAALGEGVIARGAARFVASAPRAAIEGAALGLGSQMTEDALGNHEASAEKYIASIGGGFVFGGLLGGGLHVAGGAAADKARGMVGKFYGAPAAGLAEGAEALAQIAQRNGDDVAAAMRKVSGKDIEALAERQFGHAPEGLGEKIRGAYVKGAAGVSGKDADVINKLTRMDATGREARRIAVFDSEKELGVAQREFRDAGDGMLRSNKLSMEEFQGELKLEKIGQSVRRGNEAEVAAYVRKQIAKVIDTAEAELRHEAGVAPQSIKSLEGIARTAYHADADIAAALAKGGLSNETSFIALDRVKRDVQRWVSGGHNSVFRIADPYEARLAQRSVRTLDNLQEGMRKGLEDTSLFGKAAEVQAAINADWTKQIDASKRFHNALTTEVGRDPSNPFRQIRGIDPAKADTYSRGLLNPNADLTHQAVKDYVTSTESLARTLRDHVVLPPEKLLEVEATIASAARFRKAVEKAEGTMTLVNQFKHLTERGGDGFAAMAGTLGFAAGGPAGGLLGTAVGSLSSPGRVVSQLAALERMGVKVNEKISEGVRGFLGGAKGAAKGLGQGVTAGGEAAAQTAEKVTARTVEGIREATRDPIALTARITALLGGKGMAESAPKTSIAMAATASRIAVYLRDKAPKEPASTGVSFVPQRPRTPSATEQAKFAEAVEVANNPVCVVDDLRRGRVSREKVDALKACYPQLYQQIRSEIATQAVDMRPNLTQQQQIGLSVLFDVPVSAIMQPKNIAAFNKSYANAPGETQTDNQGAPQPMQGGRGLDRRGSLASGFDKQETDQ